jgi:two-component system nitrogen regulation response regulator GlnG
LPAKRFLSAALRRPPKRWHSLTLGAETPQVLVSDIRMPGQSGLELLQVFKDRFPALPVIIMTAYSDLESAVSAFQGGAFEYLPKPFDVDQALELIRRAIGESMHQRWCAKRSGLDAGDSRPGTGDAGGVPSHWSPEPVECHCLITGESGSGKELVARAVHRHSPRADKPFIAINTAAIPRDLLESELFGHERGAFTGAAAQRQGRFEQAEGGTLFLDEIGDMPAELQTRLLRVLSDGHYYRVGGHSPLRTKVRIIAATHQDLEARVSQGLFREDLFHRLNVIRVRLPSLRERREDIPILARHFLQKSAQELGVEGKRFSEAALKHLCSLDFSGNVRQLENLCHWLTVMAPGQLVELGDLPPELREATAAVQANDWEGALAQEVDRLLLGDPGKVHEKLTHAFRAGADQPCADSYGWARIEAAQALGIGRNTITRKIQELGLDSNSAIEDRQGSLPR